MQTLRDWLVAREYHPEKGLCITVGTDGLDPEKNNIMSVSLADEGGIDTIYIEGAKAANVYEYTGVHPNDYEDEAVGIERAKELLAKKVEGHEFLVTYFSMKFTKPWLDKFLPEIFGDFEYLDVINVCKSLDQGYPIEADVLNLYDLESRLDSAFFTVRGGYKFDEVFDRCVGFAPFNNLPILEQKIHKLKGLYKHILDRV